MKKITFIHTADLHLDSPFKGLKHLPEELFQRVRNSTFLSFERIVDKALELRVDFVIISGDLYDEEDRSIRAQARLKKQFERLQQEGIAVFVIHGNHDYLGNQWSHLKMPENVKVFRSDVEEAVCLTKSGAEVRLHGFSYDTRHVHQRKIGEYPPAATNDDCFHIGILHGSLAGEASAHEPYSPFTLTELKEKNYHYWALGHIHVRQALSEEPPVIYPGNIQGRHRKETGAKGCYAVTIMEEETTMEFVETQEIVWETASISLDNISELSEVFEVCRTVVENQRRDKGVFLEIQFTDTEKLNEDIQYKIQNGELLEAFQDGEEHQGKFVWTHSIKMVNDSQFELPGGQETFFTELIHTVQKWDEQDWGRASSELFLHPQAHRYIDSLNKEEKEEIKQNVLLMLEGAFLSKEG
ncbi:metallophosphoesterase family protein [Bacillus sp. AK031]